MALVRQSNAQPVMFGAGFVAEQRDGFVEVADDQIGPAVVVQVANSQTAANVRCLKIWSALRVHADESIGFLPLIPQEHGQLPDADAHRVAGHMAVEDDYVQPAVVVHVEKSGAETDVRSADTSQA